MSRISSKWVNPKDNRTYYFLSERINFDLTPYIKDKFIEVLIDQNNPKRYYMDIPSFIEEFNQHKM